MVAQREPYSADYGKNVEGNQKQQQADYAVEGGKQPGKPNQ